MRFGRVASGICGAVLCVLFSHGDTRAQGSGPCNVLWQLTEIGIQFPHGAELPNLDNVLANENADECQSVLGSFLSGIQAPVMDGFRVEVVDPAKVAGEFEDIPVYAPTNTLGEFSVARIEGGIGNETVAFEIPNTQIETRQPLSDVLFLSTDGPASSVQVSKYFAVTKDPAGLNYKGIYIPPAPGPQPSVPSLEIIGDNKVTPAPSPQPIFPAPPPPVIDKPDIHDLRVSRKFSHMPDHDVADFAGLAIIAYYRDPSGALKNRATMLCESFLRGIGSISELLEREAGKDKQVVTLWPVKTTELEGRLQAAEGMTRADICDQAVDGYDWQEGSAAIRDAAGFYAARGKTDVADRLLDGDQDGPWLLAWAPGADKGRTEDDVLVMTLDLSGADTQLKTERVFQAWWIAVERNPHLWSSQTVVNENWTTAFVRFVNLIGGDLNFYKRFFE